MIYAANLVVLRIVLVIASLHTETIAHSARRVSEPLHLDRAVAVAEAIALVSDDLLDQEVLARIAWYESALRADVAECRTRGDRGRALGLFQLHPIDPRDAAPACGDYADQARLALSYVRRSAEACPMNVGADRLAMYVSGTCARGIPAARRRWPAPIVVD